MQLELSVHDTEAVLTVTGSVQADDAAPLRASLLDVLEHDRCDVLIDMREAGPVDDATMPALTAARSRAKYLHHRLAVVDVVDGPATAALRRNGMHLRIPVYFDPATASAGIAADREALERLAGQRRDLPDPRRTVTIHTDLADDDAVDTEAEVDAEEPTPPVQAGRAIWQVHRSVPRR